MRLYNAKTDNVLAEKELEGWAAENGWEADGPDPYASLYRKIRGWREVYEEVVSTITVADSLVAKPQREYRDFPVVETDDAIIISDVEIPDQYALMLQLALYMGMARGIKKLLIIGDLIATDQETLNEWASVWRHGDESTFEEMMGITQSILHALSEWFDEIHIIEGNHDDRVARKTGGEIHLGLFLKGHAKVTYSRYNYLYIRTTERGLIKAVHPKNFSQNPITMVKDMYAAEQGPVFDPLDPINSMEKCGFIIAHCHVGQQGTTPDGVYPAISTGTMRNKYATKYLKQSQTRHRQWDNAFIVMQNGFPNLVNLVTTDWHKELGETLFSRVIGLDKALTFP